MTKPKSNFAGETDPFKQAVEAIKQSKAKQTGSILETARLVAKADKDFQGQQQELARQTGYHKAELNKLVRIGNCDLLYEEKHREILPAGDSLLYELSGIRRLDLLLDQGRIRPDMSRDDTLAIRDSHHQWLDSSDSVLDMLDAEAPTGARPYVSPLRAPVKKRSKRGPKVPRGMFAVIGMPQNQDALDEVMGLLQKITAAGVFVVDRYSGEQDRDQAYLINHRAKVQKRVDTEIRARIRAMKKDAKRRNQKWAFHADELELAGTPESARAVLEFLGREDEFEAIWDMAEASIPIPKKYGTSELPEYDAPLQPADEPLTAPRRKKARRFSKIDFS
jgi:hypothetical protein